MGRAGIRTFSEIAGCRGMLDKLSSVGRCPAVALIDEAYPSSKITNSAPNQSVLGTLNGLAQTLSAAGRAVGPFFAGGLFSLGTHVEPKGEAIAFGVFGGVAFVGFLMSFGIRGANLESEGWDEEEGGEEDEEGDDEEDHTR